MPSKDEALFNGIPSVVFPCNPLEICYAMIFQHWYSIDFVALEIEESIQTDLNIYSYFPSIFILSNSSYSNKFYEMRKKNFFKKKKKLEQILKIQKISSILQENTITPFFLNK